MISDQSKAGFPDTNWSLVQAVSQKNHPNKAEAMKKLAEGYWPAVYAFLRRRGNPREQAAELAQAFFTDVVLDREMFAQADQTKGRLRALVLASLKNYMVDVHRSDPTKRWQPFSAPDELTREDELLAGAVNAEPDAAFDRRWALAMLEEAIRRCELHYRGNDKVAHWKAFEMRIVHPAMTMSPAPSYEEIAEALEMNRPDDAIHAVRMVRKRVLTLLRQIATETATGVVDQQSEFDHVVSLLS